MIEVLKQALEALETYHGYMEPLTTVFGGPRVPAEQSTTGKVERAITSLRQAIREHAMYEVQRLGQEIEQEPVAWIVDYEGDKQLSWYHPKNSPSAPLYTHPPQRTWQGLTEQEQGAIMEDINAYGAKLYSFADAIEAKLKEKNSA